MVANACKSQHLRLRQERSHEFKDSLDYTTIRLEVQPVLLQELCTFLPLYPHQSQTQILPVSTQEPYFSWERRRESKLRVCRAARLAHFIELKNLKDRSYVWFIQD